MSRTKRSRREFMRLLAAGTAAALAVPSATLAAAAKSSAKPAPAAAKPAHAAKPATKAAASDTARLSRARTEAAGGHAADPAEIEKQKKYTADTLKTLREFSLPPGSAMAFSFQPLKARRGRRAS